MLPEHPTSYFSVHIPTIQNNYFTAFSPSSKLQTNPTSKLSLTNDVCAPLTWQTRRHIGKWPCFSLQVTTPLCSVSIPSPPSFTGVPFLLLFLFFLISQISLRLSDHFHQKPGMPSLLSIFKKSFYLTSSFHLPPHFWSTSQPYLLYKWSIVTIFTYHPSFFSSTHSNLVSVSTTHDIETFFSFFKFIFISWRLITLQYHSGFCHTLTEISHGFTCVPHPDPPSRLPPHPIPLGLPSAPALSTDAWVSCIQPGLVICFTLDNILVLITFVFAKYINDLHVIKVSGLFSALNLLDFQ